MDWQEGIPILFSTNLSVKVLAYLLTLALITLFSGGFLGFAFLLVPFGLDAYGALIIKDNHKAFQEDVLENLEAECLTACAIDKAAPHYSFHEISGSIDHWMLKDLKTEIAYSMMAPKDDFVVIADRRGRIFPLKSTLGRVAYQTTDAGTRDVYYSDISAVELSDKTLTMTTAAGDAVPYVGRGEKAAAAAEHLRRRLRDFKSRRAATA